MSYTFTTPCCNKQLRIENKLGGRKLQCPHCDSKFYIPENPYQKTLFKIIIASSLIIISGLIFLLPSKSVIKAKEEANQLHIITTKARALLLDSTTLKMEESARVKNALEIFIQAESLIEEKRFKEAIPFFELALEKITAAQEIHSIIKSSVQPKITSLKKRITKLDSQKEFLKAINVIEKYKNELKSKKALNLISILTKELENTEKKTPKVIPTKSLPILKPPAKTQKIIEEVKVKPPKTQVVPEKIIITKKQVEVVAELQTKELNISEQETYYGEVIDDIPNGKGRYSYSNGNCYDGEWRDGKFHGKGRYSYSNGDSFDGEWQQGKRDGVGTYKWKSQVSLKAMWQNEKIHGKAFLYSSEKSKEILHFHDGIIKHKNKIYSFNSPDTRNSTFRLSKKQQRIRDFSKKISQALGKLTLDDHKLLLPDLPPHEFIHNRYFSGFMSERDMLNTENIIKQDFFSLKRYVLQANKALSPEEETDSIIGELDGYSIPTAKLGVVLDASGSMLKYIKSLKEQINHQFPSAAFIEVDSCRLTTFSTGKISEKSADNSTMNAIKYLIDNKGVDSIYWFSDLNGTRAPEALTQLSKWLDESMVALYVRSVGKKPDKELMKLIESSGGKFLKK